MSAFVLMVFTFILLTFLKIVGSFAQDHDYFSQSHAGHVIGHDHLEPALSRARVQMAPDGQVHFHTSSDSIMRREIETSEPSSPQLLKDLTQKERMSTRLSDGTSSDSSVIKGEGSIELYNSNLAFNMEYSLDANFFTGLACALGYSIAVGVQYVPTKACEIHDGVVFQWFMCNGILFVGVFVALASQQHACPLEVALGGGLWAVSNFLVLGIIKTLGIGCGFSMYHFVNLCVAYAIGRFGMLGVHAVKAVFPNSLLICDAGCALVLFSFVGLIFVEQDASPDDEKPLPPGIREGINEKYREMYHSWRQGKHRCPVEPLVGALDLDAEPNISNASSSSQTFSPSFRYGIPSVLTSKELGRKLSKHQGKQLFNSSDPNTLRRTTSDPALASDPMPMESLPRSTARIGKAWGVVLAILAGFSCALQNVPATVYNNAHPDASALSVVFPQCLGIWTASTALYFIYSCVNLVKGASTPQPQLRPAFFSGCIWAIGFTLMSFGIRDLGYEVGYALGAVGPIWVSTLFSMYVFQEITQRTSLIVYGDAIASQFVGVVMITLFGKSMRGF